jgi:hypothetical protein
LGQRAFSNGLTLLLGAVEPLERRQGETFLNWIALRAMNKLVSMYHSMTPERPTRSELGNQVTEWSQKLNVCQNQRISRALCNNNGQQIHQFPNPDLTFSLFGSNWLQRVAGCPVVFVILST